MGITETDIQWVKEAIEYTKDTNIKSEYRSAIRQELIDIKDDLERFLQKSE